MLEGKRAQKVIATVIPLKVDDGGKLLIYTTCTDRNPKRGTFFVDNRVASRRGFLRLSLVLLTSHVFTSDYVNTETILHFFNNCTQRIRIPLSRQFTSLLRSLRGKWST